MADFSEQIHHTDLSCEECGKLIRYRGGNRLSDCGHMRRSNGGWVMRDQKHPDAEKPAQGSITEDQADSILALSEQVSFAKVCRTQTAAALDRWDDIIARLEKRLRDYLDSLKVQSNISGTCARKMRRKTSERSAV
jgi:hypothetical protein